MLMNKMKNYTSINEFLIEIQPENLTSFTVPSDNCVRLRSMWSIPFLTGHTGNSCIFTGYSVSTRYGIRPNPL
jgi:hypothetical protein